MGGLPLIWGMTLAAGVFEALISRVVAHLKAAFPPVVCGLVVIMVGFSLVVAAMGRFLGMDRTDHTCELREVAVSCLTLALLVGLSVWGKSRLRLYSLLISLVVGYLAAWLSGLASFETAVEIGSAPWLALPPIGHAGFDFDYRLLPPFMVAALAAAVKTSGLVITSQRINDPDWKEPDMKNVGRGVLADALGTVASGLLGATGTNLSPTSVGLTKTTGATSRVIGFACALLLLAVAFLPKVTTVISLLPLPVLGAVLVYAVCTISGAGFRLIFSDTWDLRRSFLVGTSLLAGLSAEINPRLFDQLPAWLRFVFHSPITVAALVAIGLNLLLKLGGKTGE